jgi:Domain of unknown function (DUF4345)
MLNALRICLVVLGVSAGAIALSILTLGAEATATMGEHGFSMISHWRGPPSEHWPPSMDSELRFYSALWGAYGIVVLRTAWSLPQRLRETPWLAAIFFVGGLGRVLSRLNIGAPHPFFTLLMVIELTLPVLMTLLWLGARAPRPDRA